jgi:hypothetical protein
MRTFKKLALATGIYRPARLIHRALNRRERVTFREGLTFYRQFIRPGDLCFDIGANVGHKTEMFLSLGARVISVEPQPQLIEEIGRVFVCKRVERRLKLRVPRRLEIRQGGQRSCKKRIHERWPTRARGHFLSPALSECLGSYSSSGECLEANPSL